MDKYEFSISMVSIIFFNQQPWWLRYKEKCGFLIDSKKQPIGKRHNNRVNGGDRSYTLDDIQRLAIALRNAGSLDDEGFRNCIARIESMYKPVFRRRKRRN